LSLNILYDGDRLLYKRASIVVRALMVFTHVYSMRTPPKTCGFTHASPMKVRRWLSHFSHISNMQLPRTAELVLHMRQTSVTAVDQIWRRVS